MTDPIIKATRQKFTQPDTDILTTMHKAGETLSTISMTLERPPGSVATKVRELIKKGVLVNRLEGAMGPRGKRS